MGHRRTSSWSTARAASLGLTIIKMHFGINQQIIVKGGFIAWAQVHPTSSS
jgi:hypothetical protein